MRPSELLRTAGRLPRRPAPEKLNAERVPPGPDVESVSEPMSHLRVG